MVYLGRLFKWSGPEQLKTGESSKLSALEEERFQNTLKRGVRRLKRPAVLEATTRST